jgi:hypothetical protein
LFPYLEQTVFCKIQAEAEETDEHQAWATIDVYETWAVNLPAYDFSVRIDCNLLPRYVVRSNLTVRVC